MIAGIGTDIVDLERVLIIMESRTRERFLQRILTERERELAAGMNAERLVSFVGGRFAAKEAVVKALGCGIGRSVGFGDVEIMPDEAGRPLCHLSAQARQRLALDDTVVIHVSISHSESHAVAFALVEHRPVP